MKLLDLWKLLPRGLATKLIVLITLQQLMIAGSTWALGEAGLHIDQGWGFFVYVSVFLALTLLPQALTLWIRRAEAKGYWGAYGNFIEARLLVHARKASLWQNHDRKESFQTAIGPEAESYLTAVLFSLFDIYLFGLTILLNVTALAMVVDGLFPYAFFVAGVLSFLVFQVYAKRITQKIEAEQETKIDCFSYLLKCWDNVFLNNPSVETAYRQKLLGKLEATGKQTEHSRYEVELSTFVLTVVSHLPIFALILYLAIANRGDIASLTALLVTIPRQMYVLNNFKNFFEQINSLIAFRSRVASAWKNSEIPEREIADQIRLHEIQMNGRSLESLETTMSELLDMGKGRYILTGRNGAGKSTLLLKLSQSLPDCFYLPSNPMLEIGKELGSESTGERIIKHLDAALDSGASYLLLDEWDANLDPENRRKLHDRLDCIAESRILIEIRHHA